MFRLWNRRIILAGAFWFALLMGGAIASPARAGANSGCPTSSDEIETDRPNATNSSLVVPYGSLQVENGVTWSARQRSNVLDGPETLFRLGIARCTELALAVPDYFYSANGRASSGFSNLRLDAKREFASLPGGFTLSATAGLAFPTGASAVSGPGYNPFIQFPWSRDIADGWSVAGMFTVTWFTGQPDQNPTFEPTFVVGRQLGRVGNAVIEYVGEYDHQRPSQILDAGVVYRLTERQQVDFQAGFGLNSSSPDHFFGVGYSIRFDRLF